MLEFFNAVLYPALFSFLGVAVTKFWDWIKTKNQKKIDDAATKSAELDTEIKASDFYKGLLDDLGNRLETAIRAIEERDNKIAERDKKIDFLILEIEQLTDELRKFKQLNGKSNE